MVETYKNIKTNVKKRLYAIGGSLLITALLGTVVFAQEGTIEKKVNEKIPGPANTSDKIEKEPEYF